RARREPSAFVGRGCARPRRHDVGRSTSPRRGQIAQYDRLVLPVHHRFDGWVAELEARHLAELTFPEVSRALRALSSAYVERRAALAGGAALSGGGKRAGVGVFYGPLRY